MGSHNLSPAAWGRPSQKHGVQQLWIANYELGILRIEPPGSERCDPSWILRLQGSGSGHQLGYSAGPLYADEEGKGLEPATQQLVRQLACEMCPEGTAAARAAHADSSSRATSCEDARFEPGGLEPGEPLREVVVGVKAEALWRPGQEKWADDEKQEAAWAAWYSRVEHERARADASSQRYALAVLSNGS